MLFAADTLKKYFRPAAARTGLLLLGCLGSAAPLLAQPAASKVAVATDPATTAQQLDDYVKQYEKAGLFSGSVLVADHGRVLLQKGYGLANREKNTPNTPETRFRIASLTKQFTAALVLQLVEEGKLKLDGKVADYLPDYPAPAGRQISLHQLLSHTAGLPDYTAQPGFAAVARTYQTPAQLVAQFSALPLEFAPGTQHRYSNSGYVLLGAIIEKVTGKPYAQVFQENIARPLKLKATAYNPTETPDTRRAAGYQSTPSGLVPTPFLNMSVPYAAGAITATVTDLYRWNQALNNSTILSAASKKLLFRPVQNNYAYGWMVFTGKVGADTAAVRIQEHNGAINGFASYMVRVPQAQQCIVLLDNHSSAQLADLRRGLLRILHHQSAQPPVVAAPAVVTGGTAASTGPVSVDEATLASYAGVYELAPTFRITVRQRAGRLFVQATGQSEFETEAASPVLFALKGLPAQVEFAKNGAGQVAQLILHQGGHHQPAAKVE